MVEPPGMSLEHPERRSGIGLNTRSPSDTARDHDMAGDERLPRACAPEGREAKVRYGHPPSSFPTAVRISCGCAGFASKRVLGCAPILLSTSDNDTFV